MTHSVATYDGKSCPYGHTLRFFSTRKCATCQAERTRGWRESKKTRLLGRPRPERCEICGDAGRIFWDHCHGTGAARGWLCSHCNTALGMVRDRPEVLRKLAEYLDTHRNNGQPDGTRL